jgi:hypothetical protein
LAAVPWKRPNIGSRVNREVHARIWEHPGVRFLRATRPSRHFAAMQQFGHFRERSGHSLCGERRPFDTAELGNWKSASLIAKARCEMARVAQTKLLMRRRASSRFYYASNHRGHSGVRFRTRNRDKCYRLALCSAGATPGHRQFNADLAHSQRLPLDRR